MKFIAEHPYADPETAARKLVELANAFDPVQDERIYICSPSAPLRHIEGLHGGRISGSS